MTVGELLTQQEVAARLRRSVASIARLRRAGELAYLPGSPVMIPASEVDDYLERKMVARPENEQAVPTARSPAPHQRADMIIAKMRAKGQLAGAVEVYRQSQRARPNPPSRGRG